MNIATWYAIILSPEAIEICKWQSCGFNKV